MCGLREVSRDVATRPLHTGVSRVSSRCATLPDLRQPHHAHLGSRIIRLSDIAVEPGRTGDIDDAYLAVLEASRNDAVKDQSAGDHALVDMHNQDDDLDD